jgi:prepilin-type processing-associated H-X9-DG protein
MVSILPFIDASPLYNELNFNQPWDAPENAGKLMFQHYAYQNPGENTPVGHWEFNLAHYSANSHLMAANQWIPAGDINSHEQTFLAAELGGDFVPWACPYNWRPLATLNGEPPTYGRYNKVGALFLFVDGHVEFVTNEGFAAIKDSLSGPDLAGGDGETIPMLPRPKIFPVPNDALRPAALKLGGEFTALSGLTDRRGKYVRLSTPQGKGSLTGRRVIVDHDLQSVAANHDLKELELSRDFTDASLPLLAKLSHLRRLVLDSDRITDTGLSFVEQLPHLEELSVRGKQISAETRKRLRDKFPNCDVRPRD